MSSLIKEYIDNKRRYLQRKHQYSKRSERERQQKVIKFLKFCENQGISKIKDITKRELDMFIKNELSTKTAETKRKYLYAVKEFFKRAHLPITINVSKNISRTKRRKLLEILKILNINISEVSDEQQAQIMRLL